MCVIQPCLPTLYVRHVSLVLVLLGAEDGEGESLEELCSLLKLLLSAAEQRDGTAGRHHHTGCNDITDHF